MHFTFLSKMHKDQLLWGFEVLNSLSDSKMEKGSKKDRHQHRVEGTIGLNPFSMLVNDPRFEDIPAILETPKDAEQVDEGNLALLRKTQGAVSDN